MSTILRTLNSKYEVEMIKNNVTVSISTGTASETKTIAFDRLVNLGSKCSSAKDMVSSVVILETLNLLNRNTKNKVGTSIYHSLLRYRNCLCKCEDWGIELLYELKLDGYNKINELLTFDEKELKHVREGMDIFSVIAVDCDNENYGEIVVRLNHFTKCLDLYNVLESNGSLNPLISLEIGGLLDVLSDFSDRYTKSDMCYLLYSILRSVLLQYTLDLNIGCSSNMEVSRCEDIFGDFVEYYMKCN